MFIYLDISCWGLWYHWNDGVWVTLPSYGHCGVAGERWFILPDFSSLQVAFLSRIPRPFFQVQSSKFLGDLGQLQAGLLHWYPAGMDFLGAGTPLSFSQRMIFAYWPPSDDSLDNSLWIFQPASEPLNHLSPLTPETQITSFPKVLKLFFNTLAKLWLSSFFLKRSTPRFQRLYFFWNYLTFIRKRLQLHRPGHLEISCFNCNHPTSSIYHKPNQLTQW